MKIELYKKLLAERDFICGLLGIVPPFIIPVIIMNGGTGEVVKWSEIFQKKIVTIKINNEEKMLESLIHELRHIWQKKTDPVYYFKDYRSSYVLSPMEYNCQPAELDANAFSFIYMSIMYGRYDPRTVEYDIIVTERMNYIKKNEEMIIKQIQDHEIF